MSETAKPGPATPATAIYTDKAALDAVAAIYDNLQANLNMMLAACKTKEERQAILQDFVQARHNYDDCLNQQFHANDPALGNLISKANQSATDIKAIEKQLGDIAKVIRILSTAVDYGARIAKKIIAL